MNSKEYFEMQISVDGFKPDTLSGILFMQGCCGIQEISDSIWIIFFPENLSSQLFKSLIVKLKLENPNFREDALKINKHPIKDWNEEWKKYFKPFKVVKDLWIRPPWEEIPLEKNEMEIIIDPQMAFGTGHHETTALMIEAILKYPLTKTSVLDVGTGSGILSIVAAKLGADHITAIDNDQNAISNARHNMALNQITNIQLLFGQITNVPINKYSLIMANINYDILTALPYYFLRLLKKNGKIIISGVLEENQEKISFFYKQTGFTEIECLFKNEWIAMVWQSR